MIITTSSLVFPCSLSQCQDKTLLRFCHSLPAVCHGTRAQEPVALTEYRLKLLMVSLDEVTNGFNKLRGTEPYMLKFTSKWPFTMIVMIVRDRISLFFHFSCNFLVYQNNVMFPDVVMSGKCHGMKTKHLPNYVWCRDILIPRGLFNQDVLKC